MDSKSALGRARQQPDHVTVPAGSVILDAALRTELSNASFASSAEAVRVFTGILKVPVDESTSAFKQAVKQARRSFSSTDDDRPSLEIAWDAAEGRPYLTSIQFESGIRMIYERLEADKGVMTIGEDRTYTGHFHDNGTVAGHLAAVVRPIESAALTTAVGDQGLRAGIGTCLVLYGNKESTGGFSSLSMKILYAGVLLWTVSLRVERY